ncbi:MAG: hypothetical protein IJV96_07875 [Clostridia bacterium]|nr:hypothetical protein [Clostridia bacterium]
MKKTKLFCLLVCLAMLLTSFASCAGGGGANDGGGRTDGSWDSVDFDGQEVRFAVSVNQYEEGTFPAASVYTRDPT